MGLPHVAQGVEQPDAAPDDLANIMYWYALREAHLLVPKQCLAYTDTGRPAVIADAKTIATDAATDTGSSQPQASSPAPAVAQNSERFPATLTKAAAAVVFSNSWVHGMPLAAVQNLNDEDVRSIAAALKTTEPLPEWDNMISILGYKKYPEFLDFAQLILYYPRFEILKLSQSPSSQEQELFEVESSKARAGPCKDFCT